MPRNNRTSTRRVRVGSQNDLSRRSHHQPARDGENPDRVFPVHRASGSRCQSSLKYGPISRHSIGPSPFFQRRSWGAVLSLPAGINEDESDPMGPDRSVEHRAAIQGRMPPRF